MTTFFELMRNIVNTLNTVVRIDSQDLSDFEKEMVRANIAAVGQVELTKVTTKVNNMAADIDEIKENPFETTDVVEAGNTLPVTSAAVYSVVGNIETLLKTI